jgi:hypothetical protein
MGQTKVKETPMSNYKVVCYNSAGTVVEQGTLHGVTRKDASRYAKKYFTEKYGRKDGYTFSVIHVKKNPCGKSRRNPAEFLYSMGNTRARAVYEYEVQGAYGSGWEVVTTEELLSEARQRLKEYNENEPYPHRIVKRKVVYP